MRQPQEKRQSTKTNVKNKSDVGISRLGNLKHLLQLSMIKIKENIHIRNEN